MSTPLVIPPAVVSILRSAVLFEIGDAASEISTVSARARAESHPEWFAGHLRHFDTQRALLDALGWKEAEVEIEPQIDLDQHQSALVTALANQLDTELDLIEADPGKQGAGPQRRRANTNAREIERFVAEVGIGQERGR
jgi:N-acetyl-beta-hexosaminidase